MAEPENNENKGGRKLKLLSIKGHNGILGMEKPVKIPSRITNIRQAKRILSSLISEFVKGSITNQDAKDLAYLLSTFVSIIKDAELEQKLSLMEKRLENIEGKRK